MLPAVSRWCMYELLPQSAYKTFFAVMAVGFIAFVLRARDPTMVTPEMKMSSGPWWARPVISKRAAGRRLRTSL